MGHADPMRFHRMTLSIIIISNITIVVVADFLLAASLTVRHGLPGHRRLRTPAPPPPPAAAAAAAPAAQRRAKGCGDGGGGGGGPAGRRRPEGGEEGMPGRLGSPGQGA